MSKPVIYSSQLINAKPEQYTGYDYGYILEKHGAWRAYKYDSTSKIMSIHVMSNNTGQIVKFDAPIADMYPNELTSVNFTGRYKLKTNRTIEILLIDYSNLAYVYTARYGILLGKTTGYTPGINY